MPCQDVGKHFGHAEVDETHEPTLEEILADHGHTRLPGDPPSVFEEELERELARNVSPAP